MSWEKSTRARRLPQGWAKIRRRILVRDDYRCVVKGCRTPTDRLSVDHIVRGDNHRDTNLQVLCKTHHCRKTAQEAADARPRRQRQAERHPGLLP